MTPQSTRGLVRGLGPLSTTALVAGNIIGSGIYVVPASLAVVAGPLSLLACAAQIVLIRREPERFEPKRRRRAPWTVWASLLMVGVMIVGSGLEVCLYTVVAAALPAPYYLWLRRRGTADRKE